MSCHPIKIGESVGIVCVDDTMASLEKPEWCVCCERFGEQDQMVLVTNGVGADEWWHEACVAEFPDLLPEAEATRDDCNAPH